MVERKTAPLFGVACMVKAVVPFVWGASKFGHGPREFISA